jgi:hypothetical protein
MIDNFHGEYRFLSNFYESPIVFGGKLYPTVEHGYQACKTRNKAQREEIRNAPTPGKAKILGQFCDMRKDWDKIKIPVMCMWLNFKFEDRELADKLLATGDEELVEGNTWGDKFWGVCDGVGHNHLGKLLMAKRNELRMFTNG